MSDSADDLGTDLSKKERLINAWIAVGPEGKTTDVSDLTGSSRGYASDIRRSMPGEDGRDELPFQEIADAHDPDLVEQYRSDLADDAIDGHWHFTDRLTDRPADPTESAGPVAGGRVSGSRAGPSSTGSAAQQSAPGGEAPGNPPRQPAQQPQHSGHPQQPAQQGPQPPRQPAQNTQGTPGTATSGSRQPPNPGSGPAGAPPSPQQPQTGQQRPTEPGPPQQPQTGQQRPTEPGPPQQPQTGQQRPTEPGPPQRAAPSGFRDRLAGLDQQLLAQQQQASAQLNSLPRGSQAYAIAASKYNLVVDIRESLRHLASIASGQ